MEALRRYEYAITPGRYVGTAAVDDGDETLDETITRLAGALRLQLEEGAVLSASIVEGLRRIEHAD